MRSKLFLASSAAVAVIAASLSAQAADLSAAPIAKAPVYVPAPSWTGFYLGANAGWLGSANNTITNTGTDTGAGGLGALLAAGAIPASVNLGYNGFLGGGQVGYNWQAGGFLFGLEADLDGISAKSSTTVGPNTVAGFVPVTTGYNREIDWLSTVRGRIGVVASSQFLLYATGGLAFGQTKVGNVFICATCAPPAFTEATTVNTVTNTSAGWTVGAGAEWMFAPHWSVKAEYLYADLGNHSSTITYTYGAASSSTMTSTVRDSVNIARGGINYHF